MLLTRFSVIVLSIVLTGRMASAQTYPTKTIRIITAGAGGGNDTASRLIAQAITGPLGQPVIVENRVLIIAADTVAKAPPDGYTLLLLGGALWIIPLLQKAPYDAVSDFSQISLISRIVSLVTVHPSVPVKSVKELIVLTKAKPEQLNYASTGNGSSSHLAGELFKSMAGVNIARIPYKAAAPAVTDLISGEVHLMINDLGLLAPHVKSGKLRALAVTSATPSLAAPGLPTVAASGLPGYEWTGISGMYAPAKTPAPIIERLNREVVRVLNQPEVKERFLNGGDEVVANSPEQFTAIYKTEIAKTAKIVKEAGITAE